jgi:4-hydroxybenzoate polyprenyltransferase
MMKSVYHFFRLIRVLNLVVIGLTMTVIEVFLLRYKSTPSHDSLESFCFTSYYSNELSVFYLLLVSTLLIAAAGNIINDYFDVKADRVNKPEKLIIGKYIKRRWAMVLHWSFNLLGFVLALYIGYVLQNVWIPIVSFLSINLLWFYSAYFKRKPLIGNIMVALLLGVIPIYVLVFNESTLLIGNNHLASTIFFISTIAFLMNLVRELVKDIQDVRGDLRLNAETFPIKYGIKKTKYLIVFISLILLFVMFCFTGFAIELGLNIDLEMIFFSEVFFYLLFVSVGFYVVSLVITITSNKIKSYKIASLLLKLSMLLGLLTPLFL